MFPHYLAERVGFEPTVPCGTPDFESGTFDHSATSPGFLAPRTPCEELLTPPRGHSSGVRHSSTLLSQPASALRKTEGRDGGFSARRNHAPKRRNVTLTLP